VRADQNVGYSFDASPTSQNSLLMALQYLGFTLVLSGLLWVGRRFVLDLFQPMKSSIEAKTIIHPRKEPVTVD
jgi:hypothetical protein